MASSRIALAVPKELAINTNHPNASSVVIDLAAQGGGRFLRHRHRPSRQTGSIGGDSTKHSVKRKADTDAAEHRDCLAATTARPAKIRKQSFEHVGENEQPAMNLRSSSSDIMEQSSRTTKSSSPGTESQSTSSSLTSNILSSPAGSKEQESISPAAETSHTLLAFQSNSANKPTNNKRRKSNDSNGKTAKKTKPSSNSTDLALPHPPPPPPNDFTLHQSSSSNARPTTRNAAPRKTQKRLALEAHMLSHDAYGAVRLHEGDAIAPFNAEQHLESIKAMFDNEPLMQRIQEMYDERMRKQESQRRLQELGRCMPWVVDRFTLYEEYEEWSKQQSERGGGGGVQTESPNTAQINALQEEEEEEGCTGQTTDEEEFCESDEGSMDIRIVEMDAADVLLQIFDRDRSSLSSPSLGLSVEREEGVPAQTSKKTTYMSAGPHTSTATKKHSQVTQSERS